jgi:hypothetical protein
MATNLAIDPALIERARSERGTDQEGCRDEGASGVHCAPEQQAVTN